MQKHCKRKNIITLKIWQEKEERLTATRMQQEVMGGVNYNSPKFLKAARRQARSAGGGAAAKFLKNRNSSASKFIKPY